MSKRHGKTKYGLDKGAGSPTQTPGDLTLKSCGIAVDLGDI